MGNGKLNILFVHEVDWFNKVVFDIHSLSEQLASFGHKVFIIDFADIKHRRSIYDLIRPVTEEHPNVAGRAIKGTSVTIIRPAIIMAPFLDRASVFVTHQWAIEKTIKRHSIDVIVLYSVPTSGVQTLTAARRHGIPVVFRSIDVLHELVPHSFLRPFTFFLEKWTYSRVDKILALSPKLSEYVARMNADINKVELLLFGVDLNKFKPKAESGKLREEMGIKSSDKVVVYVGTMFPFSGLDIYLKQFSQVVEEIKDAKLVLVGGGALFTRLKEMVTELNLESNVILTGFQPYDKVHRLINMADLCLNPSIINGVTRDIIPGKIMQYLACGKPVLATPLPGMLSLLKGFEQGIFYSDIKELGVNTVKLLKDTSLLDQIGRNGLRYVVSNHDEAKLARKLEGVLLQQVAEKRHSLSSVKDNIITTVSEKSVRLENAS
jgi:glycosyltransferase involved in cell wall biosynthesis